MADRVRTKLCTSCEWYKAFTKVGVLGYTGKCMRYPPSLLWGDKCVYSEVKAGDFCGEWKKIEEVSENSSSPTRFEMLET